MINVINKYDAPEFFECLLKLAKEKYEILTMEHRKGASHYIQVKVGIEGADTNYDALVGTWVSDCFSGYPGDMGESDWYMIKGFKRIRKEIFTKEDWVYCETGKIVS